jgi:hypothetical protein
MGLYWALRGYTGFHGAIQGFTGLKCVAKGYMYWVEQGYTGLRRVILLFCITQGYLGLFGIKPSCAGF